MMIRVSARQWSRMYRAPEGFSTRLRVTSDSDRLTVRGTVVGPDLKAAASFVRRFQREDGHLAVHHESLRVNVCQRRKGIASTLLRNCLPVYRDLGVSRVMLNARQDGALVWPRYGFANGALELVDGDPGYELAKSKLGLPCS